MIKKKFIQKIRITFLVICLSCSTLSAKSNFEIYGDIAQFLPLLMVGYSYYQDDMQGIVEQTMGSLVTFGITAGIKESFVAIAKKHPQKAKISQRPKNGSYNGFPSGHTSFAFSAVGFAQKRYGYKVALPMTFLATSVGISRVYVSKHTIAQVIAGATLGTLTSYWIASQYEDLSKMNFYTSYASDGSVNYHMGWYTRF